VEGDLRRKNGGTVSMGIIYAPLFGLEGRLVNIIANVRDITRFREADEIKSTFVSVISHELKTPVALIQGYAETLLRKDARWDPQTQQDSLEVILEEADRLNRLIDDLLDASRLEAGKLSLEMEPVALDELTERVTDRFRTQTDTHEIRFDFAAQFPPIKGDPARLEQVLKNLLSNAIKYSPEGGRIEVAGHYVPEEVIVTISDQGVGIPFEEQPHVFESFFRGSREQQKQTSGAGLGLYLAKAIIEAHDGRIWLESNPGEGAAFSFAIPR
jgi:signal transduction histidine kinase